MSRPRLHWVSPLPPAETDIAHYTGRILPALAAVAEVVLWTDAQCWAPWLERHATVRTYAAEDPHLDLAGLPGHAGEEIVVFQLGNSWLFHAGPFAMARRVPGIVVLHDTGLQDLMLGLVANGLMAAEDYRAGLARWYGARGAGLAERVLARTQTPGEAVAAGCPGFELAAERALAALVHAPGAFAEVAARKALPVYGLDLPFAPGPAPGTARAATGPLRLVQFGYTAPNRRLDQVLETLGGLRDEIAFEMDVFGTLWDEPHVRAKIAELGLSERVRLNGFVAEETLDAALARAHLVFNLRSPTMGEASGSQLRIWNAGAASVVTEAGWYAELPPETAFRVPEGPEHAPLAELLRRIDADRDLSAAVGAAGRARLEGRHAPDRYARGLRAIADRHGRDAREGLAAEAGRRLLAGQGRPGLAAERLARLIGD